MMTMKFLFPHSGIVVAARAATPVQEEASSPFEIEDVLQINLSTVIHLSILDFG
jgi:hypothetical protein